MTELSFLVDLLLNHKLSKPTREAVAARIKEVEAALAAMPQAFPRTAVQAAAQAQYQSQLPPEIAKQAPSMQAIMLRHADIGKVMQVQPGPEPGTVIAPADLPVAVIAQTPAAAAAMASRNQAIAESLAGKVDKTTGRPRKF